MAHKGNFSKFLVWFIILLNIVFATAVLFVFWHTGAEPSTLVVSWFAFTSSELIATAFIKGKKIRKEMLTPRKKEEESY